MDTDKRSAQVERLLKSWRPVGGATGPRSKEEKLKILLESR
jgi:hypothetical protein